MDQLANLCIFSMWRNTKTGLLSFPMGKVWTDLSAIPNNFRCSICWVFFNYGKNHHVFTICLGTHEAHVLFCAMSSILSKSMWAHYVFLTTNYIHTHTQCICSIGTDMHIYLYVFYLSSKIKTSYKGSQRRTSKYQQFKATACIVMDSILRL